MRLRALTTFFGFVLAILPEAAACQEAGTLQPPLEQDVKNGSRVRFQVNECGALEAIRYGQPMIGNASVDEHDENEWPGGPEDSDEPGEDQAWLYAWGLHGDSLLIAEEAWMLTHSNVAIETFAIQKWCGGDFMIRTWARPGFSIAANGKSFSQPRSG
jgi:hypothetical protein